MILIPFTSAKESFTCQCGDFLFRFDTLFNDYEQRWHFRLTDETTGEIICTDIAVLLGLDLLYPFNLGIGGMFAADMTGADVEAGPDDLGNRVVVGYYTQDEIDAMLLS